MPYADKALFKALEIAGGKGVKNCRPRPQHLWPGHKMAAEQANFMHAAVATLSNVFQTPEMYLWRGKIPREVNPRARAQIAGLIQELRVSLNLIEGAMVDREDWACRVCGYSPEKIKIDDLGGGVPPSEIEGAA